MHLAWYDRDVAAALLEPSLARFKAACSDGDAPLSLDYRIGRSSTPAAAFACLEKLPIDLRLERCNPHTPCRGHLARGKIAKNGGEILGRLGYRLGGIGTRLTTWSTEPMTTTTTLAVRCTLACTLPGDELNGKPSSPWRYVIPAAGDPFDHAPFRALVLSREKPDELIEKVAYRGEAARSAVRESGSAAPARRA